MAATVLETLPSEFDYFGQIPAHTTLTADGYEPILPTSPIAAQQARSKIIFKIPGISSCYRDLAKSFMVVKCRVVAANNANLGANDEIAPVNLMLSSLFSSVDVSICNKQINDTCTLYPYRAFLENLLTYDADVHPMRTVTAGWELDMDAETMDLLLIAAANNVEPNPAHVKRNALINTSRSCTLVGRIHADIFNQSLAIPAECEILVSFTPATDSFVLMAAANATFKVIIDSACLMVRSLSATTDLVLAHRRMVDKTNFRFPYDKVDVQAFVVSPGVTQKIFTGIFPGKLPKRIICGLVAQNRLVGTYNLNPFKFENHNLTGLNVKVNTTCIPRDPSRTNFATGDYQLAYINTLDALDLLHGNRSVPLTPNLWATAYNLYAFKLVSGDIDDGPAIHPNELYGNVSIRLDFSQATNAALALLVYSETPSLLEITNLNTVLQS